MKNKDRLWPVLVIKVLDASSINNEVLETLTSYTYFICYKRNNPSNDISKINMPRYFTSVIF